MSFTKRPGFAREVAGTAYVDPSSFSQRVTVNNGTQFGEVLTAKRTPIIELNSSYGTSALRDVETVTGSGAISAITGEILLSTGATATSSATLESAEQGRYIPGYGAQLGIGARVPTNPTGNQYGNWGGVSSDGNNGFYFGRDATGPYVAYLKGGSETKIRQTSWNIDPLDGTGISGYNLDTTDGNIYQIDFTWYGYGQIVYGVVGIPPAQAGETADTGYKYTQTFIPCHSFRPTGGVSVESPNLRIYAEANNGGDAVDFDLYVGGRQYSIIGDYIPKFRFTGGDIRGSTNVSTTTLPLISFRRKTGFSDRSIKMQNFELINDGTGKVYVEIYLNATLTGASWGTPTNSTAAETALESDIAATAISGGTKIWGPTLVDASATNKGGEADLDVEFDIPEGQTITLACTALSGTNAVFSTFKLREEW